ncbi:GIY-YIG nuclease family protein [Bacillus mangrovi]|uniref:GIY-YIG nuclease family protein n=1 Tax=Metabacillus mangrovi TaxID=1491830 RepID=A0A7X2S7W7_9BACI|nr:GIY-YIG nuclease family protein [Metabacillus mangrovi]
MEKNSHYFYVLECRDGSYYGGYSNHLAERLKKHNEGKGAKYTRARRPVELIYAAPFGTKTEAMREEYFFKRMTRKNKEKYLEARLPIWKRMNEHADSAELQGKCGEGDPLSCPDADRQS